MSRPQLSELVIDTDDSFDDASTLTGAQSFVDSLNSPSVFDRLSFKKSYSASTKKGVTQSRDYTNRLVSTAQQENPDRRRSLPVSPPIEIPIRRVTQPPPPQSPKVEKNRSPPKPIRSEDNKTPAKESFFDRMARTETYASASRKPNPVKNKVAQISAKKGIKKESVEKRVDQPSQHESALTYEVQRSFSSSSQSSQSMEKEPDEQLESV
jgi:hypothetical protein